MLWHSNRTGRIPSLFAVKPELSFRASAQQDKNHCVPEAAETAVLQSAEALKRFPPAGQADKATIAAYTTAGRMQAAIIACSRTGERFPHSEELPDKIMHTTGEAEGTPEAEHEDIERKKPRPGAAWRSYATIVPVPGTVSAYVFNDEFKLEDEKSVIRGEERRHAVGNRWSQRIPNIV